MPKIKHKDAHRRIMQAFVQRAPKNPTGARYPDIDQPVGLQAITRDYEHGTREGAYDHWSWPWPVAVNRYTFFNAWYGNQVPGFGKNPIIGPWVYLQNQQFTEYQRNGSISTTGMSQVESSQLIQGIEASWAATDEARGY